MLQCLVQSIIDNRNLIIEMGPVAKEAILTDEHKATESEDFQNALRCIVEPSGATDEFYDLCDEFGLAPQVEKALSDLFHDELAINALHLANYVDEFGY